MSILQWNIRGLKPNYAELTQVMSNLVPQVVCLQETKLPEKPEINITGYAPYHQTYTDGIIASGGNTILINKKTIHREIKLKTKLQAKAIRATLHKPTTICSVYIPPNHHLTLKELIELRDQLPKPFIILGDFNAHSPLWGNEPTDQKGKVIEDFLTKTNTSIMNTNNAPTFQNPHNLNTTSIDLTFCSPDIHPNFQWSALEDTHGSDHYPITLTPETPTNTTNPQHYNFKKANWTDLIQECKETLNEERDINIEEFTTELNTITDKHIPKTTLKQRKNKVWFNEDCAKAVNKKRNTLTKFIRSGDPNDLTNFKIARAQCRQTIRQAKRNSFKKYVGKINNRTPMKKIWKMIKKLKGTHKETIQHTVNSDGTTAETERDVANSIATCLSKNSSSKNYNNTFQKIKTQAEKKHLNFTSDNTENYNSKFTLEDLKTNISELNDTAPGPDKIHNKILQQLPDETLKLLTKILNNTWDAQDFPNNWRQATIIPIPKPGKDLTNPTNYRPIALTSCLCKLMEKLVNKRLMWYLETTKSLSNLQCGFRKTRSTTDHLVRLETFIREAFIRKEHITAVFFDLEKAFDTTWKYGILKDLHELGLRGNLPIFIENFIKHRSFQIKVGSELSDPMTQEEGVPQGSILSPILFEIKINSITKTLQRNIDSSLYVDDFLICYKTKGKIDTAERQIQLQLNKLETWANENGFKFSPSKTVAVHFCQKRSCIRNPELKIYNETIPVKNEARFLGVIFDKKLSFLPHIKTLKTRCQTALNALKVFSNPEWGGDSDILLQLYRSMVRSKLDYACQIYGSARKSYIKMLNPIQNQGLRLALGAFRTSPEESLHVEANEPPLELRRKKLSLQYALKLSSTPENPAYNQVFNPKQDIINITTKNENIIKPFSLRIREDLKELNITEKDTENFFFPKIPPWTIKNATVNLEMTEFNKTTTNPNTFKKEYQKLVAKYPNYEKIFTDGSKTETAVGSAATLPRKDETKQQKIHPEASIYSAEATALELALEIVKKSSKKSFLILSDSLSCLTTIKQSNTTDTRILQIRQKVSEQIDQGKTITFAWLPSHVGIDGNENADKLAKEALKLQCKKTQKIHHMDLRQKVQKHISSLWEKKWNEQTLNKLHKIKPKLGPRKPLLLPRKDSVIFTRLKIGHTSLTHKFLLQGEDKPECISCNTDFTIKHILTECVEFQEERNKQYRCTDLKTIFDVVEPKKILKFIKEIGLYEKL